MATKNPLEYRTPSSFIESLSLKVFTNEEILASSCKEICNPQTFDQLMHPVEGGLYDPAMGPVDRFANCITCQKPDKLCPGHFGHISLPLTLLNGSCIRCGKLYIKNESIPVQLLLAQLRAVNLGLIAEVDFIKNNIAQMISHQVGASGVDEDRLATELDNAEIVEKDDILLRSMLSRANEKTVKDAVGFLQEQYRDAPITPLVTCRNITQKKRQLIRTFCQKYLFYRPRRCPHCKEPARPARHQYLRSILVGFKSQSWKTELMAKPIPKKEREAVDDGVLIETDNTTNGKTATRSKSDKQGMDILEQMRQMKRELDEMEEIVESLPDVTVADDNKEMLEKTKGMEYTPPWKIKEHMRIVWYHFGDLLKHIFPMFAQLENSYRSESKVLDKDSAPTDALFYDILPVVPSKFRPIAQMYGMKFENAQTTVYRKILESCESLRLLISLLDGGENSTKNVDVKDAKKRQKSDEAALRSIPGKDYTAKFHNSYIQLQMRVNNLFDGEADATNKEKAPGFRQILEKKEGLFRKHMMGKRVNFCCRTVITPDPYQDMDQIGIPDIFAKKLTYPASVNPINLPKMRKMVELGPDHILGANYVVNEDGAKVRLDPNDITERQGVAKRLLTNDYHALKGCKKVYRHLMEGDVMLLNRQPTLHKPSIQAHTARILRNQKVIRLHYAVCKPYNADFDGDEMNAHFPQNDVARSEAAVPYQYLVPKDGSPVLGLIQDHIISGVLLTIKDQFFTKEDYNYLVLSAFGYLNKKLKLLQPAIMKPVQRWTGKQIVSTVILNVIPDGKPLINLAGKAKTSVKSWQVNGHEAPDFEMSESEVIFRGGELLSGVLDKADYGPTAFGLIHCCYELYHPKIACRILSCFSRLFTTFLQYNGFSLGVADVLVSDTADLKRRTIIQELRKCGTEATKSVFHMEATFESPEDESTFLKSKLEEVYSNDDVSHIKELDYAMKTVTDKFNDSVNKACLPHGLVKLFPDNSLQCMIESGAKGNMVNQVQMSCMLGQIELEGCRPPLTPSGRTLPSFEPYDCSPRAGGFVDGRFATGIRPQEFFFHTMAGREGLIDTAVKTSRSGYLQRCIIKHLEGVMVNYDSTVRDSDGSIIQFQYGEDGIDIGRSQFLSKDRLHLLANNLPILLDQFSKSPHFNQMDSKKCDRVVKKLKKWRKRLTDQSNQKSYMSPFTVFSSKLPRSPSDDKYEKDKLIEAYRNLDENSQNELAEYACPDPVSAQYWSSTTFGALSEKSREEFDNFVSDRTKLPRHWTEDCESDFRRAFYWKNMKAQCDAGDPVGIVAAQSIGEPSTQMTLNTFHFAGRGEMNVTLGIPRLREILMTGSARIATPIAQVPFLPYVSKREAENLKRVMDKLYLKQFLKAVKIYEKTAMEAGRFNIQYIVEIHLLRRKKRDQETKHVDNAKVIARVEKKLFKQIGRVIKRKLDKAYQDTKGTVKKALQMLRAGERADNARDGENSDDEQMADVDAADEIRFRKQNDETEYIGELEEKDEIMPSDNEESSSSDESENESSSVKKELIDEDSNDEMECDTKKAKEADAARIKAVLETNPFISSYSYDADKNSWCRLTIQVSAISGSLDIASIVAEEIEKFVVQETHGIQRCILREEQNQLILQTEGINLQSFYAKAEFLNINKIGCNDIHTIARIYGIEAAASSLMNEINMVFGGYGIHVDHRHLSLIADYMCYTGAYEPFNRMYMGMSASPFQKMSFETTTEFLKEAIFQHEFEPLTSPSSRLSVGGLVRLGTGSFDLMVDVKKL